MQEQAKVYTLDRQDVNTMVDAAKVLEEASADRGLREIARAVQEFLVDVAPQAVAHVDKYREEATIKMTIKIGYNDADEVVATPDGGLNLKFPKQEMRGEILQGKLKLW